MKPHLFLLFALAIIVACSEEQFCEATNDGYNLPCEYSYELSLSCFCGQAYLGPHFLRIREGQIIDYINRADSSTQWDSTTLSSLRIEYLIDAIKEVEDSNEGSVSNVEYHSIYDFPIKGNIDFITQAIDDELGFEIQDFKVY